MWKHLHVKHPLFLSDFNGTWIFSTDFKKKSSNFKNVNNNLQQMHFLVYLLCIHQYSYMFRPVRAIFRELYSKMWSGVKTICGLYKKQCGQGRLIKFKSHKIQSLVRRLALLVIIAVACLFCVYSTTINFKHWEVLGIPSVNWKEEEEK